LLKLVDSLFGSPAVTIGSASKMLKVTHRAATLNIGKLVDAGILQEVTGRLRSRVFVAREIVRAVEEDLPPSQAS
jgi:Fic family protein